MPSETTFYLINKILKSFLRSEELVIMKTHIEYITAILLSVSILIGYTGVEFNHHICNSTGVHSVSIFGDADCEMNHCTTKSESNTLVNNKCFSTDKCCTEYNIFYQLVNDFVLNNSILEHYQNELISEIEFYFNNYINVFNDKNFSFRKIPPPKQQISRIISFMLTTISDYSPEGN